MNENKGWNIPFNKDVHKYVIGIDFGHGETSAAICEIEIDKPYDQLKSVVDICITNRGNAIPSAIATDNDGKVFIGEKAITKANLKILRPNHKIWMVKRKKR